MVAFGLIWLGGLLDDTSCVFTWILGGYHEYSRMMDVAACFLLFFAGQMVINTHTCGWRHVACARAAT